MIETCLMVGVKNGVETVLGKMPMPPEMKLKHIVRSYFSSSIEEEEDSDAYYANCVGLAFLSWLISQGWSQPKEALKDVEGLAPCYIID